MLVGLFLIFKVKSKLRPFLFFFNMFNLNTYLKIYNFYAFFTGYFRLKSSKITVPEQEHKIYCERLEKIKTKMM